MPNSSVKPTESKDTPPKPSRLRIAGLLAAAPCWIVLAVGLSLNARAKGDGTHTQLGLTPCRTMVVDGIPCPGCGLTTSITAAVHGDLIASVKANVFGTFLFFVLVFIGSVGIMQALAGRDFLTRIFRRRVWLICGIMITGTLVGWAIKLAIGYNNGQYPTH